MLFLFLGSVAGSQARQDVICVIRAEIIGAGLIASPICVGEIADSGHIRFGNPIDSAGENPHDATGVKVVDCVGAAARPRRVQAEIHGILITTVEGRISEAIPEGAFSLSATDKIFAQAAPFEQAEVIKLIAIHVGQADLTFEEEFVDNCVAVHVVISVIIDIVINVVVDIVINIVINVVIDVVVRVVIRPNVVVGSVIIIVVVVVAAGNYAQHAQRQREDRQQHQVFLSKQFRHFS
jgi:hypothetical protein